MMKGFGWLLVGLLLVGGVFATVISDGGVFADSLGVGTSSPGGLLEVENSGTGTGLLVDQNGDGRAILIEHAGTTSNAMRVFGSATNSEDLVSFDVNDGSSTGDVLVIQNAGTGDGLFVDQDGNGEALSIDSEATTLPALDLRSVNDGTSGSSYAQYAAYINPGGNGGGMFIFRNVETAIKPVSIIEQGHASNDQVALQVKQDGTGRGLFIDQNGNGDGIEIENAGTESGLRVDQNGNGKGINVEYAGTTQFGLLVEGSAARSGNNIAFFKDANAGTTVNTVEIENAGTGDGLFIDQNGNGVALDIDSEATTAYGMRLYSNAIRTSNRMFFVHQDNPSSTIANAELRNDGDSTNLILDQNGDGIALGIDSETDTNVIDIDKSGNGHGFYMQQDSGTTRGASKYLFYLFDRESTNARPTAYIQNEGTGDGLFIDQNGAGSALNIDYDGGNGSYSVSINSNAADTPAMTITGGGCTTGRTGLYESSGDLYWCRNGVSTKLN